MTENRLPMTKTQSQYRYFKRPPLHGPNTSGDEVFHNPKPQQIKGDIRIGYIMGTLKVFGILLKEMVRHLLVCGSSGAGKSNFLRILQIELNRLGIPFLAFDTTKLGSRFLKKNMKDLIVLRWGKEFCFNPFQPPPGVGLKEWLMVVVEITKEIFELRTASMLFLLEFIQERIFKNEFAPKVFPTLFDLHNELELRLKQKIPLNERGYINGIRSKIKAICITLDKMINVRQGICIEKLLQYPVCIELVGIKSSKIQYWLISLLMAAIASYREARPMSFGGLRHAFFIDEAAYIVGDHKSGESYIISCIRRLREYGEAIVLADQCISSIKDVVKNNTFTIVGMSQTGQKDRREMINVLGLNTEQAAAVHLLDVGQAIVRLGGRYPYPQLITFPLVKPENISEKELDKINATDPRVIELVSDIQPADSLDCPNIEHVPGIPMYTQKKDIEPKPGKMSQQVEIMLMDIYSHFDMSSTARAKELGFSASTADKVFKFSESEGLVEKFSLNLSGGRGRTSKFYSLTDPKGYELIRKDPPKKSGGTGAVHFFIERYLEKHLPSKGFTQLKIEKTVNGKRIDVFAVFEDLKIGIEICCTTWRTEHLNFLKDKDSCDLVVIVAPDRKTKGKLDKELGKNIGWHDKLRTCVLCELLNHPEQIINKKQGR